MKMMRRTLAALAAGAVLASAGSALAQNKVLRFVQNGNLTILDPIWTTAYVTRNFGYMVYGRHVPPPGVVVRLRRHRLHPALGQA